MSEDEIRPGDEVYHDGSGRLYRATSHFFTWGSGHVAFQARRLKPAGEELVEFGPTRHLNPANCTRARPTSSARRSARPGSPT